MANVIATTDMTLLAMDRDEFKRVLGPLEDILKRNFKKYEKFMWERFKWFKYNNNK